LISSLSIRNFQSHANLRIDELEPITTFVGKSNSGKSAVIRALIWLITNKPTGTAHIKHGENKCRVAISLDGGKTKVVRLREGRTNIYKLDGVELANIGSDAPDTVRAALNIAPASIQQQHDAPFMLGLSPKQLATTINKLAGLDVADKFMAAARSASRDAKATAKAAAADLEDAEKSLDAAPDFTSLKPKLAACDDLVRKIERLADDIGALEGIIDEIERLQSNLLEKVDLSPVDLAATEFELADRECDKLQYWINFATDAETALRSTQKVRLTDLDAVIAEMATTSHEIARISEAGKAAKEANAEYAEASRLAELSHYAFESEFGGKGCPLCGKK
jgi:DNA repair exonuclease SbcCD ATPase subunit